MSPRNFHIVIDNFFKKHSGVYGDGVIIVEKKYNKLEKSLKHLASMDLSGVDDEYRSIILTILNKSSMLVSRATMDITRELEKIKKAIYEYGIKNSRV